MKYNRKQQSIEAVQWTGKNLEEIIEFSDGHLMPIARQLNYELKLKVLLSGSDNYITPAINDFIIKTESGYFSKSDPSIFNEEYELA
jgi:hypothetical protein